MSIEGRIAVDVSFADTATSSGVQSLKKITLVDTQSYTTGKVAIVTGTVGTASVNIETQPMSPAYRDASGAVVSFARVSRVAFQASRFCLIADPNNSTNKLQSSGAVGVSDWNPDSFSVDVVPQFTAGTASYTLVLYGT